MANRRRRHAAGVLSRAKSSGLACALAIVGISACKDLSVDTVTGSASQPADLGAVAEIKPVVTATQASWADIRTATVAWTYLKTEGRRCVWVVAVAGQPLRTVARGPGPCTGGGLAWSNDNRRGAWWGPGEHDEIQLIDFDSGRSELVMPPKLGELADVGFLGPDLVALMRHTEDTGLDVDSDREPAIAHFEGEAHELSYDGIAGLVLVYQRQGSKWNRIEIEPTSYDWDLAAGVDAAPVARNLGPRSQILGSGRQLDWIELPPSDPAKRVLEKIRKSHPKKGSGWMAIVGRPRLLGYVSGGEFVSPEAPLFRELKPGDVRSLKSLPITPGSLLSLQQRGSALIARAAEQAVLVDWIRDRPIAPLPDGADPLMFWPRTSSTATSAAPK